MLRQWFKDETGERLSSKGDILYSEYKYPLPNDIIN